MKEVETFDADLFIKLLIEDVEAKGREGKKFVADPFELGPRLMALQKELESRPALVEITSPLPDEADSSQSSS